MLIGLTIHTKLPFSASLYNTPQLKTRQHYTYHYSLSLDYSDGEAQPIWRKLTSPGFECHITIKDFHTARPTTLANQKEQTVQLDLNNLKR